MNHESKDAILAVLTGCVVLAAVAIVAVAYSYL